MNSPLGGFAPICIVALAALVLVMSDVVLMKTGSAARERDIGVVKGSFLTILSGFFVLLALVVAGLNFELSAGTVATPHSMLVVDPMANFAMTLLCCGGMLTLWISLSRWTNMSVHRGESYPLLLLSLTGALAAVCSANLISLFVAFELMSLPVCVLAGFDRGRPRSFDTGMRALLAGAFPSALSLYGIALIYGATGHFDYPGIHQALGRSPLLALGGSALLLVGILSRLGAVPFHRWWLDLAEGGSTVATSWVPTTVMTASAFALIRILDSVVPVTQSGFTTTLFVLSAISMIAGATMALVQRNAKRMLAYAAVAQTGFLLAALTVPTAEGRSAALLHLTTFLFMQLGAFGALAVMDSGRTEREGLGGFAGRAEHRPIIAAALTLFLLALAGLPGTSGFISRLVVMSAAISADQIHLAILMGFSSVMLFAVYLRIPTTLYMRRAARVVEDEPASLPVVIALSVCAFVTVYLGFFPGQGPLSVEILEMVERAIRP